MGHQPQGLTSSRDSSVQHVSPASVEAETSLAAGRGFLIFVPTSIFDRRICPCPCSCVEGETLKESLRHKEREAIPKSEPGHIRDAEPVGRQLSPFAPVGAGQRFNDGVCGDGLTDQSRGARSFLVVVTGALRCLMGVGWGGTIGWCLAEPCRRWETGAVYPSLPSRCTISQSVHQPHLINTPPDSKPGQLKTLYPVKARKNQPPPPPTLLLLPRGNSSPPHFPQPLQKTTIYRGAAKYVRDEGGWANQPQPPPRQIADDDDLVVRRLTAAMTRLPDNSHRDIPSRSKIPLAYLDLWGIGVLSFELSSRSHLGRGFSSVFVIMSICT